MVQVGFLRRAHTKGPYHLLTRPLQPPSAQLVLLP